MEEETVGLIEVGGWVGGWMKYLHSIGTEVELGPLTVCDRGGGGGREEGGWVGGWVYLHGVGTQIELSVLRTNVIVQHLLNVLLYLSPQAGDQDRSSSSSSASSSHLLGAHQPHQAHMVLHHRRQIPIHHP